MSVEPMYQELSCAASVEEVVKVTRDYLSSWEADELRRLPEPCWPRMVACAQDIERWADRLATGEHRLSLFPEDERRLDRLTNHFLIASLRLRQILGVRGLADHARSTAPST